MSYDSKKIQDWDEKQRVVIEYPEAEFGLVEAGPGTGKTAVACQRIAHLIEERGLEASKILLVSFTRAAVKELRDRIESFMKEPINAAGLKLCTLDSFTWQVLRGLTESDSTKLLRSYEENIKFFNERLEAEDEDILEFIEELEHVIIDEAQDLVGDRADLVINLLKALPEECGATVFADSAQAIYGWTTEDGNAEKGEKTVVERIHEFMSDEFQKSDLENIHRTSDPALVSLYTEGRKLVLKECEASPLEWKKIKDMVRENAHESISTKIYQQPLKDRRDVLILYRSRLEVLIDSSYLWSGPKDIVPHKIRIGGMPSWIHSWVARVLSGHTGKNIRREEFAEKWDAKISRSECSIAQEHAWEMLLDHAAVDTERIDLRRLRSLLSRSKPPVDFLVDERDLPGPTLGTIHSSKGREADSVYLVLPSNLSSRNVETSRKIAEEMRVIFVGASRARKRLITAKRQGTMRGGSLEGSGRTFKFIRGKNSIQVQIGIQGDLEIASVASRARFQSKRDAIHHQEYLWRREQELRSGNPGFPMVTIYDGERKRNVLYEDVDGGECDRGREVALMSEKFGRDLFVLRSLMKLGANYLPGRQIRHIRMTGAGTVVVNEGDRADLHSPYRESGLVLVPFIFGFTPVYFNKMEWR